MENYNLNKIKELIKFNGYNQEEIAKKMGMSKSSLSQYLNGFMKIKKPIIEQICEILGIGLEEIVVKRVESERVESKELESKERMEEKEEFNRKADEIFMRSVEPIKFIGLKVIGGASCGNFTYLSNIGGDMITEVIPLNILSPLINMDNYDIKYIQDNYFVFYASGESMLYTINPNDKLVVKIINPDEFISNRVYICIIVDEYGINSTACKRIIKEEEKYILRSDNPDKTRYPDKIFEREAMNSISIRGLVLHRIGGVV